MTSRSRTLAAALLVPALALASPVADACTNFLVTKGASADGSTMISYTADSHELYGELYHFPAARHAPGAKRDIHEWDTGTYLGQIDEVPETYAVVGNMNEHQVAVGETTFGGREELKDPKGIVDYGSLMYLALQRAKTAREAIGVMTGLVEAYGYASTGESFSISDPDEVWILEMIGKGPGRKGAVWVARKVPDGYVSAHANAARIRRFPLDDPQNTLYAKDVIAFAREKGYFSGKDEEFSFADAYAPVDFGARRFCDARVWCLFHRTAPSAKVPVDWATGKADAEPMPLWVKPDRKLTVADVKAAMRDHFEDTPFDMTNDVGAGPYDLPYRWRPLTWKVDGQEYLNERAVSTQQTGFSFVAQARGWLPDPIGGILWFGVDDSASTVWFPVYCGITEVPRSFAVGTGSFEKVDFDAAFWVFNQVSNYAYLRYSEMIQDIRKVQGELEAGYRAQVADIDSAAAALYKESPRLAREYLTRYSVSTGDALVARWRQLYADLLYKYLDGNTKDEHGKVTHPGYPESWYRKVAAATGEQLLTAKTPAEIEAERVAREKAARTAQALLALLQARGLAVSDAEKERILGTEKAATLEGWLVKAATAGTVAEVLGAE